MGSRCVRCPTRITKRFTTKRRYSIGNYRQLSCRRQASAATDHGVRSHRSESLGRFGQQAIAGYKELLV